MAGAAGGVERRGLARELGRTSSGKRQGRGLGLGGSRTTWQSATSAHPMHNTARMEDCSVQCSEFLPVSFSVISATIRICPDSARRGHTQWP